MASIFPQGVSLPDMRSDLSKDRLTNPEKIEPQCIDLVDKDTARVSGLHIERRDQFEMKAIHDGLKALDEEGRRLTEWTDYWATHNQAVLPPLS